MAGDDPERAWRRVGTRRGCRAGPPLTAPAMAVAGDEQRSRDLELHRAAVATTGERTIRHVAGGASASTQAASVETARPARTGASADREQASFDKRRAST